MFTKYSNKIILIITASILALTLGCNLLQTTTSSPNATVVRGVNTEPSQGTGITLVPTISVNTNTQTPENSSVGQVRLFLSAINVSDAGDGWQDLKIDIGIRNDSSVPYVVNFPQGDKTTVTIQEGRDYEAKFAFYPHLFHFLLPGSSLVGFPIPPGFAYCGIFDYPWNGASEQAIIPLQVETRIPQGMHPSLLQVAGYPTVDLTGTPDRSQCKPSSVETLPALTTEVDGPPSTPGSLLKVEKLIRNNPPLPGVYSEHKDLTLVVVNFKNKDQFDNLTITDFNLVIVDNDGIVRTTLTGEQNNPEGCQWLPKSLNYRIGPSQAVSKNLCYPERPSDIQVAAVVMWADNPWYAAVRP